MADDKGGGGAGWEAFEVIVVILLAIGLISRLTGRSLTTPDTNKSTEVQQTATAAQCGLSLTAPHALERISGAITLSGSTAGCNWPATETVALYAQAVDSYGTPVSSYSVVPPATFDNTQAATFQTVIPVSANPHPGTGYLILIPAKSDATKPITARIPLTF